MTVTLQQLFAQSEPEESVLDDIGSMHFSTPLEVRTLAPEEVGELNTTSPGSPIKSCVKQAQRGPTGGIIKGYRMDIRKGRPMLPIVTEDGTIIDGHHRAMAAFLEKVPLQYVDIGAGLAESVVNTLLSE